MMFDNDILYLQRLLSAEGLYKGKLDAINGPLTSAAMLEHDRLTEKTAKFYGNQGLSEKYIKTLLIVTQIQARKFLNRINKANLSGQIISSTRTYTEQDKLWGQGRNQPGNIVTKAQGGHSMHNFGLAWDVGIFDKSGTYIDEPELYRELADAGLSPAIIGGINFKNFIDPPHYQINLPLSITEIRSNFEAGTLAEHLTPCWQYI
jgi:peptidoglycan L-alanyl-D-glutamate endopeptidase CwlK